MSMMFAVYATRHGEISCHQLGHRQHNWYSVAELDPAGQKAISAGTPEALEQYLHKLEDDLITKGLKREFRDEHSSYRVFARESQAVKGASFIGKGVRLGPWINEDHCSMRCIEGTNPEIIANRVAFIEKTPRVRVARAESEFDDWKGWHEGPKGCGQECGRYAPSREWCDEQLKLLGYELA